MEKPNPDYYTALVAILPYGLTEAAWARKAGVSSSFFQDLKNKGTRPRVDTLQKLLNVAQVTPAQFNAILGVDGPEVTAPNVTDAGLPYRHRSTPADVPVYGTAEGATYMPVDDGGITVETTTMMPEDAVDYIRRPIGIAERKNVYALFVVGVSMEPRYLDGEPIFVDPTRTPAIGDHVVLQLVEPDLEEGSRVVRAMVKRLDRRTADYYELHQYTPGLSFRVAKSDVAAIHRVIPPSELHGI